MLWHYIHASSPQAAGPFLALNCASLPRDQLESELLDTARLSGEVRAPGRAPAAGTLSGRLDLVECAEIEAVLAECGGSVGAAATRLGVNRATLYRRMKKLGISRSDPSRV